jgi:methylase of polypeptide subunit release factors
MWNRSLRAGVGPVRARIAERDTPWSTRERSERFPTDVPQSCVVSTPRPLADAIAGSLGDEPSARWLEPCVGDGVFLVALNALGVQPRRIRGLDIRASTAPADHLGRTLRATEFLAWSSRTSERFERIIANPPFLALNRAPKAIQRAALKIRMPSTEQRLTLGTNCWLAFLCSSISLLKVGGSLGFVLPAAWEYADYARPLRRVISALFGDVTAFRSREPLFRGVLEGSIVLIARGYWQQSPNGRAVQQRDYRTATELITALRNAFPRFQSRRHDRAIHVVPTEATPRGSSRATDDKREPRSVGSPKSGPSADVPTVGSVFRIRLGGVTGDARFFLLSDEERRSRGLPVVACRPVISRAHHLSKASVDLDEWRQLRDIGERVWLFDPKPSQLHWQAVAEYLRLAPCEGGCHRGALKVRVRELWFRTPIPRHIDGFMSGMSGWGPWVVFRDMPALAATNTLYVIQFVKRMGRDEQAAWAMWLLTTQASHHLSRIGRRYADGLVKYEPGDVADLPVQRPVRIKGAYNDYLRAVALLVTGHKVTSRQVADSWFSAGPLCARLSIAGSRRRQ